MPTKPCVACGAPAAVADGPTLCSACALRDALTGVAADSFPTGPFPMHGQPFGDFELLDEIGRGGMGVVFRARQVSLDRLVALKMLLPGLTEPEYLQRFRTEASTAAALQHPHIVAIHEVGVMHGTPYLVMDLVAGRSLAERIAEAGERPTDYRQAARWLATTAHAIEYAHERGILHRDLKPSNVLIDGRDEPRVTDFGLAKRVGAVSELTISGHALGSPGFMAPEQAGGGGKVSRRSDVYGLGATLYYALTRRAPFAAESAAKAIHDVLTLDVTPPRRLDPAIPRDLETICLKCLERDPRHRYPTAKHVAEELERFLDGRPILARPTGTPERIWRWCRRRPALAALGLAIALCLVAAGWLSYQLKVERVKAAILEALQATQRPDAAAAERAIGQAERQGAPQYWVHLLRGQLAIHQAWLEKAVPEFEQAVALAPGDLTARSMLAAGYLYNSQLNEYTDTINQLNAFVPRTWEEYYALGVARVGGHPDTAQTVALLEKARRLQPSGFTFVELALAEIFHAQNVGSCEVVQKALADCKAAEALLGSGFPPILAVRMNAHNVGLRVCQGADRTALEQGVPAALAAIAPFPPNVVRIHRPFYFGIIGDRQAELDEWRMGAETGRGGGFYTCFYAASMFGAGRSAEADRVLANPRPSRDVWTMISRAYLLLDLGRREEALQVYEAVRGAGLPMRHMAETIRVLAGELDKVRADVARIPPASAPDPLTSRQRDALDYWAGRRSGDELVASAGPSRDAQGIAHYVLGVTLLARGDRAAARQHFQRGAETGQHFNHAYHWSRAFLARLEADPQWPPWVK